MAERMTYAQLRHALDVATQALESQTSKLAPYNARAIRMICMDALDARAELARLRGAEERMRERCSEAAANWARKSAEHRERTGGMVGMSRLTPTDYAEAARAAIRALPLTTEEEDLRRCPDCGSTRSHLWGVECAASTTTETKESGR